MLLEQHDPGTQAIDDLEAVVGADGDTDRDEPGSVRSSSVRPALTAGCESTIATRVTAGTLPARSEIGVKVL